MTLFIFALFIIIPLTEVYLFIEIGQMIGGFATVGMAILTAVIGVTLVKAQGVAVVVSLQRRVATNQAPISELFDALCLLIASVLLITPGFFTDTIGFALLVPPLRKLLRVAIFDAILARATGSWFASADFRSEADKRNSSDNDVIDAEFEVIEEERKER